MFPGWEIMVTAYFNDLGVEAKYYYDYGDSWCHRIKLEGYISRITGVKYPHCIGGERACPPEDCGGPSGYENLVNILSNRKNEEYEEMKTWAGERWHPEQFEKANVKFDNPYRRWVGAFLEK